MLLAVLQPTAANHQAPRQGPEREFMYEMVGGGMEEQGGVVTLFPLNSDFPSIYQSLVPTTMPVPAAHQGMC